MPDIGRRGFLASAAGATLLVQGSNDTRLAFAKPQDKTGFQVQQNGSSLTLAKGDQSWTFDLRSGAIARIGREGDGKSIEIAGDAASAVRLCSRTALNDLAFLSLRAIPMTRVTLGIRG